MGGPPWPPSFVGQRPFVISGGHGGPPLHPAGLFAGLVVYFARQAESALFRKLPCN